MRSGPDPGNGTPQRVLGIGSAVAAMVAVILVVEALITRRDTEPPHPPAPPMAAPGPPIPAEAFVFRIRPGDLAAGPAPVRRDSAHRRTLATARSLRAYPGAPPRIPHGLTAVEFRDGTCNTCHERGGYAGRFEAYAPVTPHPEYGACLQCHVPDDAVVGVELPRGRGDAICLQCHVPDRSAPSLVPLDWHATHWPATGERAMDGSPPVIPHDLQLRGNCLACHAGPAAVEEIRTTHPERASCRQCHVPAAVDAESFSRPLDAAPPGPAGAR